MKLYSDKQSIKNDVITIVSIIESIIAVAFSIILATYLDTIFYIAVGVCVAPLLLMRSKKSMDLGIELHEFLTCKVNNIYGKLGKFVKENIIFDIFFYPFYILASFIIRIFATCRHPIEGIKSIPNNWKTVVLCTDSWSFPELIPGTGVLIPKHPDENTNLNFSTKVKLGIVFICFISAEMFHDLSVAFPVLIIFSVFLYALGVLELIVVIGWLACVVVAWLYRFSLKSTSLIWFPLVYVSHKTFRRDMCIELHIDIFKDSAVQKLSRAIAWLTIFLFLIKILLLPQFIETWNQLPWTKILNVYIMPNRIHLWHLVAFANAVFAQVFYFFLVDPFAKMLEKGMWKKEVILRVVKFYIFFSSLLSIYTIFIGIYLTVKASRDMEFPVFDLSLWPI